MTGIDGRDKNGKQVCHQTPALWRLVLAYSQRIAPEVLRKAAQEATIIGRQQGTDQQSLAAIEKIYNDCADIVEYALNSVGVAFHRIETDFLMGIEGMIQTGGNPKDMLDDVFRRKAMGIAYTSAGMPNHPDAVAPDEDQAENPPFNHSDPICRWCGHVHVDPKERLKAYTSGICAACDKPWEQQDPPQA